MAYMSPLKVSLENGWLAGFTDAEGCFTVSTVKNAKNNST